MSQQVIWWLNDNRSLVLNLAGLILLLVYYLLVWNRYGRDSRRGYIIPRYEPPDGLSPAVLRFVDRTGFDKEAASAAIINLAVKGFIIVDQSDGYSLERTNKSDLKDLPPGEQQLLRSLFSTRQRLVIDQENHKLLGRAIKKFSAYLQAEFQQANFRKNGGLMIPGILLTILVIVAGLLIKDELRPEVIFLAVWLSAWTFACYYLVLTRKWLSVLVFTLVEIMAIGFFVSIAPVEFLGTLFLFFVTNIVFYHLLQAPTRRGRKLMDEIEGFRTYLKVAQKDRLNLLNEPEKTPALYEKYLPYALALDVDQQWSEKFSRVLHAASTHNTGAYRPHWYYSHGNSGAFDTGMVTALATGLTGAIADASVAPGSSSSSGFGGGGSSGGGGW